uniref:uncharacterized protein LOC123996670 isoform X2 n=1 Tax=Oncorhynchus gorbuscha TaxID=8017 RepID=UPI001EAF7F89|nr:uncharacterized protein LOC123996670 isoform X2 [Oncorhynchus gorbuscha]
MSSQGNEPEKMGLFQQEVLALKSQLTQQEVLALKSQLTQQEVLALKSQLTQQEVLALKSQLTQQEVLALKSQLTQQEREMAEAHSAWREKLELAEKHKREETEELQEAGITFAVDNRLPNLVNLNEDPQLSEMLLYMIKEGQTKVGQDKSESPHDIQLWGPYRRPPLEEESERKHHWEMDQQQVASKMEELQSAKVELEQEVDTSPPPYGGPGRTAGHGRPRCPAGQGGGGPRGREVEDRQRP